MKSLLLMIMIPAALFAQVPRGQAQRDMPRGPGNWWDGPMLRELLSPEQARQIPVIQREYRNRLVDVRAAVEKAENNLEDIFNDETIDQKRAADAIEGLAVSRAELTRAFSQFSLKLRAVLTPQQWHELQRRRAQQQPPPGQPGVGPRRLPGGRPPGGNPTPPPAKVPDLPEVPII